MAAGLLCLKKMAHETMGKIKKSPYNCMIRKAEGPVIGAKQFSKSKFISFIFFKKWYPKLYRDTTFSISF